VKVSTAAWLSLLKVNSYCSVAGNDPEESSLLVPDPTPNAGAYGGGHRNRLTPSGVRHIPSAAPSRVALLPSQAAFAVSRRLARVQIA